MRVRLRRPDDPHQVAFLELFFDLVFVFAFFQLSHALREDLTGRGALHTLVLLLALWWVWNATSGATDRFDPRHPTIQWLVLGCMFGCFLMAAAVPEAFDRRGSVFAGAYLAVQAGRALILAIVTRADQQHRPAMRLLFWLGVSSAPWLAGTAARGSARLVLWGLAVAVDYTAAVLRFPAPGLGRASWHEFALEGEYLAERHRQFFNIALGELILTSGLAFSGTGLAAGHVAPTIIAFATTALLGRVYVHRAGGLLGTAIAAARDPYHITVLATYAQPLVLAGVVPMSAGFEAVIQHPLGRTPAAWAVAILGGPAVFLVGRALYEYAVHARVSLARLLGIAVLEAIAPAMTHAPPVLVALAATAVLAAVAVFDSVQARTGPSEPSPPAPRRA